MLFIRRIMAISSHRCKKSLLITPGHRYFVFNSVVNFPFPCFTRCFQLIGSLFCSSCLLKTTNKKDFSVLLFTSWKVEYANISFSKEAFVDPIASKTRNEQLSLPWVEKVRWTFWRLFIGNPRNYFLLSCKLCQFSASKHIL